MNIRYARTVSAPTELTYSSGFTTLPRDLLIFSPSSPRMTPWLNRRSMGSLKLTSPMSRITFVQKRVYSRCITACSTPPVYWSTGSQYRPACGSKGRWASRGLTYRYWYQDESMNVSIVSVSRSASPPHCGQRVRRNLSCSFSGDSPVGRNSASSGRRTGRSDSGTGTVPHRGQKMMGMGVPQ